MVQRVEIYSAIVLINSILLINVYLYKSGTMSLTHRSIYVICIIALYIWYTRNQIKHCWNFGIKYCAFFREMKKKRYRKEITAVNIHNKSCGSF